MSAVKPRYEDILPETWKANDDAVMERFMGSLPTVDEMEEQIQRIDRTIPSIPIKKLSQQHFSSFHEDLDFNLDLRGLYSDDKLRFHPKSIRYLYEIMLSAYLVEIKQSKIIDFDIHINSTPLISLLTPVTRVEDPNLTESDSENEINKDDTMENTILSRILSEWVKRLQSDNAFFFASSDTTIIRRGLLLSSLLDFHDPDGQIKNIGHQFFIVLEKRSETPNKMHLFIVDNLKEKEYIHPIHEFIWQKLTALVHANFSETRIKFRRTFLNRLPMHDMMGTCMSVSFRAMALFCLLQNPFHRLVNAEETQSEASRMFLFVYYQLQRMRLFLLRDEFGYKKIEPLFFSRDNPGPTSASNLIRRLNTSYFWGVFFEEVQGYTFGVTAPNPKLIEDFIRRIGPDGEDFPYAKRYYFVCNLKYKTVLSTDDLSYDVSTCCITSKHFPFNQNILS